MSADILLDQAADVLEKMAMYLENQESQRLTVVQDAKVKIARELATKIAESVGEPIDDAMIEKLSELGPDMQALLGRVTGSGIVDSLGGPEDTEKIASVHDGIPAEDNRFLTWVQS